MPQAQSLKDILARFQQGAEALHPVIAGLTTSELDSHPIPGKWSIRELVIHVLDSDLIATHRMKRIAAEDTPLLISYDENAFVKSLYGPHLDVTMSCDLFRLNRLQTVQVLEPLADQTFQRTGVHNQRGKVTLAELLEMYAHHVDHHLKFAWEKRRELGKPTL